MQHSQNDFIVAVLLVIDSHQDGCDSATVKDEIDMYIDLFDEDLKPYGSRRKHEPRYRQLVGNLFSHRTPELFKYLNKTKINKRHYKWSLNTKGKIYVANIKKVKEAGKMLIEYSDASLDKAILKKTNYGFIVKGINISYLWVYMSVWKINRRKTSKLSKRRWQSIYGSASFNTNEGFARFFSA